MMKFRNPRCERCGGPQRRAEPGRRPLLPPRPPRARLERQRQRGWRLHEPQFFERRRVARLRYTELWKRSQGKPWLTELSKAEAAELRTMERDELAVEDIVQFQALGRVQLAAEEFLLRNPGFTFERLCQMVAGAAAPPAEAAASSASAALVP